MVSQGITDEDVGTDLVPPPSVPVERRQGTCGRPPGINPERRELLAAFSVQGLTLTEIAAVLGVSRQCVHAQLNKCGALPQTRRARLRARRDRNRLRRAFDLGLRWLKERGDRQLLRFLHDAERHGWRIDLEPGCRVRINGVPLAFHQPRRLHGNRKAKRARYYHFQITRPEWLHVVCLPDGRYVFYLPDRKRPAGTYYIRSTTKAAAWPKWPGGVLKVQTTPRRTVEVGRRTRDQRRAA